MIGLDFLRRQVSDFFVVERLLVVGDLSGPWIEWSHFDLAICIDKNIVWSDVSSFFSLRMVSERGWENRVNQVPKLILLEHFITEIFSIFYFIAQEKRVIVVGNDGNTTIPAQALLGICLL